MIMFVILLVVLGFALYMLETYIPMAPPFKLLIRFVVILFIVLMVLQVLGLVTVPLPLKP